MNYRFFSGDIGKTCRERESFVGYGTDGSADIWYRMKGKSLEQSGKNGGLLLGEDCMDETAAKSERLLQIFFRLIRGDVLLKKELAQQFHVTERSIRRDLESLRCFFAEQELHQDIVYDRKVKGYRLEQSETSLLNNGEILAVCKILMESRSMRKDEMFPLLDKLVACSVPEQNKKLIARLLVNEKYHYTEPYHGRKILPCLWEIEQAVQEHRMIKIRYDQLEKSGAVERKIKPIGILFSEYYFYLMAFREGEPEEQEQMVPAVYRVDRIKSLEILNRHFQVSFSERFQEKELRKKVQLMCGGKTV